MEQKLDYRKTFLLGFGFLGVSFMSIIYNSYVPNCQAQIVRNQAWHSGRDRATLI
jgi:hypothetical protein